MKSTPRNVGSLNLRGKKTKQLRCGCCAAFNCKEDELKKEHAKEMRNAKVSNFEDTPFMVYDTGIGFTPSGGVSSK